MTPSRPIVRLQRADALGRLRQRTPRARLALAPARHELFIAGRRGAAHAPAVADPQPAAESARPAGRRTELGEQASQRLDALRQAADASSSLTPEQARQLDELLQQAQADLTGVHTQQEATAILARTQTS